MYGTQNKGQNLSTVSNGIIFINFFFCKIQLHSAKTYIKHRTAAYRCRCDDGTETIVVVTIILQIGQLILTGNGPTCQIEISKTFQI